MLFVASAFLAVADFDDSEAASKIAPHRAVRLPNRAIRLFPVLLPCINAFTMKTRAGPYGPYDKITHLFVISLWRVLCYIVLLQIIN